MRSKWRDEGVDERLSEKGDGGYKKWQRQKEGSQQLEPLAVGSRNDVPSVVDIV